MLLSKGKHLEKWAYVLLKKNSHFAEFPGTLDFQWGRDFGVWEVGAADMYAHNPIWWQEHTVGGPLGLTESIL